MPSQTTQARLPTLNLPIFLVEFAVILIAAVFASSVFLDFDPAKRLGGIEAEYLTRTAYTMGTLFREKGYIPLWDPYMESGDPHLDNPVSFAFNPVLTWPSLAFGPQNGVKVAILLTAVIAGLGGWALARVLGFGPLARLLLALLCVGKGNMHSFLSEGHISFYVSQSYFPWIFAGVIGILRGFRRWPVVLTAVGFAFVFWTGIPWYPPALVIAIGILTLVYAIRFCRSEKRFWRSIHVDWPKLGLVTLSMIFALGLSAIVLYPLWEKRDNIGGSMVFSDFRADIGLVLSQYVSGVKELEDTGKFPDGKTYGYYSYIVPLWYAILIIALLGTVVWLRREALSPPSRLLVAALAIFIFCTLWGAGQNPIIELLYQLVPLAAQFRHVERVLGLASLWLGVIAAAGLDVVWCYFVRGRVWADKKWLAALFPVRTGRLLSAGALIVLSGVASFQVLQTWHVPWGSSFARYEDAWEDYCVSWLRDQYPDRELAIWTLEYKNIYTYYRNRVRHGWVASDFYHVKPGGATIFAGNLLPYSNAPAELFPEFALGLPHFDDSWLAQQGYKPIPESANPYRENIPCLYRREGSYNYAYWVTRADLDSHPDSLPVAVTHPISNFVRDYDRIAVLAQATLDADVVVTVQEVAYSGWSVQIDGRPAQLENVGGQIGVVLPRGNRQHVVFFQYLPQRFFAGSVTMLATALICALYLLRAERVIGQDRLNKAALQFLEAWDLRQQDESKEQP
jgi:hypothetical protein